MGVPGDEGNLLVCGGDCFVLKDAGAIAHYAPRNDTRVWLRQEAALWYTASISRSQLLRPDP
jgi:hypothetical protein